MEYKKQEINEIDQINEEAWFFRSTDSNRALVLSQEAVRRAEAAQYERGIAEGLRTLGFSHIRLANYPEAIVLLTRANEMFKQTGDLLPGGDFFTTTFRKFLELSESSPAARRSDVITD